MKMLSKKVGRETLWIGLAGSFLLGGLTWAPGASGVGAVQDKPPGHMMRILAVGNRAPFRQELRGGVRHEVDPPEGSLPPAEVHVFAPSSGEESPKSEVRLRLGEVSPPLRFPVPESGRIRLRDSGNQTWLEPAVSPEGATLVIAWRTGPKWNQVVSLSLDDSAAAIPEGACRVVNASHIEIGVALGSSRYRLPPGKSCVLALPAESSAAMMEILHAAPGGALKAAFSTTVSRDPAIRRQWIVHRSDQPGARRPIGITPVFEPR